MATSVRLGLVGAGDWGQNYISTIDELSQVEIVCVSSKRRNLKRIIPSSTIMFESFDQIDTGSIDAVIIATPAATHVSIATFFANFSLPMIVEKPLAIASEDARVFFDLATKKDIHVRVGYTHLYSPAYQHIKRTVGATLGKFNIKTVAGKRGPFRKDVGVLFDWGSHDVAMAIDLVGSSPDQVEAWQKVEFTSDGAVGEYIKIILDWNKRGKAEIELSNLFDRKRRWFEVDTVKYKFIYDDCSPSKLVKFAKPNSIGQSVDIDGEKPLTQLVRAFSYTVIKGGNDRANLSLGLAVTETLERCQQDIIKKT